jgi:Asp-tRNA(Asn)/Glu-tRNA(Gln) amidotransferase A subunit family amidase
MTIVEAAAALRARKISSEELVAAALQQIERTQPRLNAFLTVTAEAAKARARECDAELARGADRGPLHGIPVAVKDVFCTKGVRTTGGSKLFESYVPEMDAAVVERLAAAGAVLIGKTGLQGCTSSRMASPRTTRISALSGIPGTRSACPADRAADPAPPSPRIWCSWPWGQTPADPSAFPRPSAAWSA